MYVFKLPGQNWGWGGIKGNREEKKEITLENVFILIYIY